MEKGIFYAVILTAFVATANAAETPAAQAPKGTICFTYSLRDTGQGVIACKGLGKFSSVAEIYDRGYRVVSSGVMPEAGTNTVFFFVEERK